ncbi:MAG: M28 family peptidase [Pedobacter sp.]|nr:MAG: M28 family peptidase [Pedobacter sp.]
MKKKFLYTTSLALCLSVGAMAQKNPDAVKFSETINKDRAYSHLSILASDEYEGRNTAQKGGWMAAEYIKKQFQSFGLKGPVKGSADPYLQPVGLVTNEITSLSLSVNGKTKTHLKDFAVTNNGVPNTGLDISGDEIVFAGYGLTKDGYDDFAGINAEGKILLIFSAGDPTAKATTEGNADPRAAMMARQRAMASIQKVKPKAVIYVDLNFEKTPEWQRKAALNGRLTLKKATTSTPSNAPQRAPQTPTFTVSAALANEILKPSKQTVEALSKQIMESAKPNSFVVKSAIKLNAKKAEVAQKADNVLGFLEGSDPKLKEEVLVITAHYDHDGLVADPNAEDKVYNGADDDGSGTTGILLLAEAFSKAAKAGKGPKRSILFMTVTGEEKGLLGSEWYAENPVFPVANTITNLNIDMIGRGDDNRPGNNDFVYIIGSNMLSDDLDRIGKKANEDYVGITLDEKYNNRTDPNRFYYRSDHYNFAKFGIPVIFYFNGVHKDYHKPSDEVDKIDFPMLAKRSQLVYFTAWELANGANRPVVNKNEDGTLKTN